MSRWLTVLVPLLGGCIIYDHEGKCWDCGPQEDGRPNEGGLETDTGDVTEDDTATDEPVAWKFALDPAEAFQGETFIAHLTQTGSFDLSQVTGADFVGDAAEVLASENNGDELLLSIHVPATTAPGVLSMLLFTADGGNEYVPEILTVLAAQGDPSDEDTGGCP